MPIEPVNKKIGDSEVKLQMDNPAVIAALQKGSIFDLNRIIMGQDVSMQDVERFAASQWNKLMGIYQTEPVYEGEGAMPPPDFENNFLPQEASNNISDEDNAAAGAIFSGKAMMSGKAQAKAGFGTPDIDSIESVYNDANSFLENVFEPKVLEIQFAQQLQANADKIEQEMKKIYELAKSGSDIAILLLVAKTMSERNGLLFTQVGQRYMREQQRQSAATDQLSKLAGMPGSEFNAAAIRAQQDIRASTQTMQMLIGDMQKVAQNIESVLSSVKSIMTDRFKMTELLTRNINPGGGGG